MAEGFNPYHVWLSIPPEEQPPNHYRLLGLRLFENSGDVIDSAADRQTAHLRTFQGGKHGDLTQQLLNEVAAARVRLLDPRKRASYDQQLRAGLPLTSPTAMVVTASPAAAAMSPTASGSAISRRPSESSKAAPAAGVPVATALPQAVDPRGDLLGDPTAKPVHRSVGNSTDAVAAKGKAVKQGDTNNRTVAIGTVAAFVLIAAVGISLSALKGPSDGAVVFDWPLADRADITVAVDGNTLTAPPSGPWEYPCAAGSHHIVAEKPAFKIDTNVAVAAGQKHPVAADWKAKATLALNWPLAMRVGAELKVDGRAQPVSESEPLEVAVEPGRHSIQITRPGMATIGTTAIVAADGRELVSIKPPPPTIAKLVFDWPVDERKDAELTIDGQTRTVAPPDSGGDPFALKLDPGRHVVRIARKGFEPFSETIDLGAGASESLKPLWTPERIAPKVVEVPASPAAPATVKIAPQIVKKTPVPTAADQKRIAKQLADLYQTPHPGPKDLSKALELYDVASKAAASSAERYMMFITGAEIAAAAGNLDLALQGIDTLDADYEINALEAKQKLLDQFVAAGKPDQVAVGVQTAEKLVDQAVAADQYEIALALAATTSRAVVKSKIPTRKEVEDRLSRRRRDIHLIEPIYAAAKKSQETLGKDTADPEANLAVGRWRCLYKEDWAAGLPLLAKGSDEGLKTLAEQDLTAATEASEQFQVANSWWDLAQKEAGIARDSIRRHAGNIYQSAMPNLASVLQKAAIEKRLAEIANLPPSAIAAAAAKSSAAKVPSSPNISPAPTSAASVAEPAPLQFAPATANSDKPMGTESSSGKEVRSGQWLKEVAALPAEQQVVAVVKKLQQLNSDFDGQERHKIEGGVVTEFELATDNVTDISPLKALTRLKRMKCAGSGPGKGGLSDLSPLKGMSLLYLDCGWTRISDLSPLQGLHLITLQCGSTQVADLSPLKHIALTYLDCGATHVADLSPLKGMPLNRLICDRAQVSNLSPLKGMPLRSLNCSQNRRLSDLSPLSGMGLTELFYNDTNVSDLSPLKGMPLKCLYFDKTRVADLSSLAGLALNEVAFTPQQIRVGLDVLRRMPSVKTLRRNAWDAAATPDEFWRKFDAGEFNK